MFTAQGDMRQALNNLQSTFDGFGFVSANNVFKVIILDLIFVLYSTNHGKKFFRYVTSPTPC